MVVKSGRDHALSVVKAAVAAVPVVGGPLASLIGDYVPTSTSRSLDASLQILGDRLKALGDRIDVAAVNKEEFAELFKSAYLIMVRAHKAERRRAAANLVANVLLRVGDPDRLSYNELDHFARALEALSVGALLCAAEIYRDTDRSGATLRAELGRLNFEDLAKRVPDYDADLLMGLLGELNAQNIVHLPGVPTIRTQDYGNYPIERTTLGSRFVARLLYEDTDVT